MPDTLQQRSHPDQPETFFAPPQRASTAEVEELSQYVRNVPLFQAILEAIDGYMMILNPERQILAVNHNLLEALNRENASDLIGKRPGEVIDCVHAGEMPGGCGTAEACAKCGAVIAILQSQDLNEPVTGECLATVHRGDHTESLEFRVRATPVHVNHHVFTVLAFQDISGQKRREALERTFFHDILNTIGGLLGWSSLLQKVEGLDPKEVAGRIMTLSNRLTREIQDQRRMTEAENGTLALTLEEVTLSAVLATLRSLFEAHDQAKDRTLVIEEVEADERIRTDSSLLLRVLTNMIKNALEATMPGGTVRVWREWHGEKVKFLVNNPGEIHHDVALRIFQRSFSTKGQAGRGIGTYSMKLFGERYLGGEVGFESSEEKGTIFWIELPKEAQRKQAT